jgi:hypothetical protein
MSEEQQRQGFFSRMFSPPPEDEGTTVFSAEEVETGKNEEPGSGAVEPRGFTVERAADIIRDLPPEVPRRSAVRIVRQTLAAAGISVDDLGRSTRTREAKLNSEIELSQGRIKEIQENTDEVVRSLEEQIKKAREARDSGVAEEERRISAAREGLDDVERVRDFFDLPRGESRSTPLGQQPEAQPEQPESTAGDETQVMQRPDMDDTQILRRGPLSEGWEAPPEDRESRRP